MNDHTAAVVVVIIVAAAWLAVGVYVLTVFLDHRSRKKHDQ